MTTDAPLSGAPRYAVPIVAFSGVGLTHQAAGGLVWFMDHVARSAPHMIPPWLPPIRAQMIESCASVTTFADESEYTTVAADHLQFDLSASISPAEAAKRLGKSEVWVRKLCEQGRLRATKDRRQWRIDPASVELVRRQEHN
jgi:excisionase family DNA binding protein